MGIKLWPKVEKYYKVPDRFNLAIDGNGIFFNGIQSLKDDNYLVWLLKHASQVLVVFDGKAPFQKGAEQFSRCKYNNAYPTYLSNRISNRHRRIYSVVQQIHGKPILAETKANTYGEGEHKILHCHDWNYPQLPVLCVVNDADFYISSFFSKPIETNKQTSMPNWECSVRIQERFDALTHQINLKPETNFTMNYYKVTTFGVIDFWHSFTFQERLLMSIWITVCWGNDYVRGIIPKITFEKILQHVDEINQNVVIKTHKDITYSFIVKNITHVFHIIIKKYFSNKITSIENIEKLTDINSAIDYYIYSIVWNIFYMFFNHLTFGAFDVEFSDVKISWPKFSHEMEIVTPIYTILQHCCEQERYYNLQYDVKILSKE